MFQPNFFKIKNHNFHGFFPYKITTFLINVGVLRKQTTFDIVNVSFFYHEKSNLKYVKIHIIFRRGSRLWLTVVRPCSIVPPTFTYIAWYFSEWTLMSAPSVVLSATPLSRLIDDQILSDDSFYWQPIMDILLERKVSMKGVYRLSKLETI